MLGACGDRGDRAPMARKAHGGGNRRRRIARRLSFRGRLAGAGFQSAVSAVASLLVPG